MNSPASCSRVQFALRAPSVAPQDRLFITLLNGFRSSGGLQRLKTLLAARLHGWGNDVIEQIPVRLAERRILGITWDDQVWVPGFQFEVSGAIKPAATAVFGELMPSHDPWELADWFITPSTWLKDGRPIDLLDTAPARVIEAARADRYVANWG